MGIKSTRLMTREEVENHIKYRLSQLNEVDLKDKTDTELEDLAEELDEKMGDIFTNYLITDEETARKDREKYSW